MRDVITSLGGLVLLSALGASGPAFAAPGDGGWEPPPLPRLAADPAPATCAAFLDQERPAMGSRLRVELCARSSRDLGADAEVVFAEFRRLEALLTTWRPDSEIARLNAQAGRAPVAVSADTLAVLQAALDGSTRSGGLFDVTFASLGLWHFDEDADGRVPTAAEVEERRARIGSRHLHLDATAHSAFLDEPTTRIDLGGIGKGFAVDRAAALLRRRGLSDFLLQAGGDLYCAGRNGDRPWVVGVRDPRGAPDDFFATLEVRDAAFSTSGDDERFFIRGGRRYHHIIDPRTGYPATASRSATVLAPTATLAEELSKPMFILGPEAGVAFAEKNGAAGVIVGADNRLAVSASLRDRLDVIHGPTAGVEP